MTSLDTNPKIKEAMDTLLKIFDEENLEKVARAVFRGDNIPADKWSFLNRLLMVRLKGISCQQFNRNSGLLTMSCGQCA